MKTTIITTTSINMVRDITGKHPAYFEAILQLRDVSQDVVDFVEREFSRGKIPITQALEVKNGLDFYAADSNFTRSLGRRLQEKFGGELVLTASLYGVKKDREVYRVTVLFRGASFAKGDTVEYKGDEYVVVVLGNEIILQEKGGKKLHVKYREMMKVKKMES